MEMMLSALPQGQNATIKSLHLCAAARRRLYDFGMIEGTKIRCLRQGVCGGPSLYCVRGTMLALRKADGARICVELCE